MKLYITISLEEQHLLHHMSDSSGSGLLSFMLLAEKGTAGRPGGFWKIHGNSP